MPNWQSNWPGPPRQNVDPSAVRAFRSVTGTGFSRWRRLSRLTLARELLLRGLPPTAVARHVGYAHLSGFSRAFRAEYGVSPRRFTERVQYNPAAPDYR